MTNYKITYHKPDDPPVITRIGDLIFTRGENWYSSAIRIGQMIEARKFSGPAREINHMAIAKGNARMSEALSDGIQETSITRLNDQYYAVVHTDVHPYDARQIMDYIDFCEMNAVKYGWLTIASLGVSALFGSKLNIGIDGTMICSGYACQSMLRAGHVYEKVDANYMTPHLAAEKYGVDLPYF